MCYSLNNEGGMEDGICCGPDAEDEVCGWGDEESSYICSPTTIDINNLYSYKIFAFCEIFSESICGISDNTSRNM